MVMAVGDVCKEDAKCFWEDQNEAFPIPVPNLSFDEVYDVLGAYYVYNAFVGSTSATNFNCKNGDGEVETSLWCHLRSLEWHPSVMKELRDKGVIQYTDEFGEEAVDEMIKELFFGLPTIAIAGK